MALLASRPRVEKRLTLVQGKKAAPDQVNCAWGDRNSTAAALHEAEQARNLRQDQDGQEADYEDHHDLGPRPAQGDVPEFDLVRIRHRQSFAMRREAGMASP